MTTIELSRFYLETNEALSTVITELSGIEAIRPNWLRDAKEIFESDNPLGSFILNDKSIANMESNSLGGNFVAALEGLRQLDLLFYRKKYYFDETHSEEEHLTPTLQAALELFYRHADSYLEDQLAHKTDDERLLFFKKLRYWGFLKNFGSNASNEISTLISKEATRTPHPILLDVCLAKECTELAVYLSKKHLSSLSSQEATALRDFAQKASDINLDFWNL